MSYQEDIQKLYKEQREELKANLQTNRERLSKWFFLAPFLTLAVAVGANEILEQFILESDLLPGNMLEKGSFERNTYGAGFFLAFAIGGYYLWQNDSLVKNFQKQMDQINSNENADLMIATTPATQVRP